MNNKHLQRFAAVAMAWNEGCEAYSGAYPGTEGRTGPPLWPIAASIRSSWCGVDRRREAGRHKEFARVAAYRQPGRERQFDFDESLKVFMKFVRVLG